MPEGEVCMSNNHSVYWNNRTAASTADRSGRKQNTTNIRQQTGAFVRRLKPHIPTAGMLAFFLLQIAVAVTFAYCTPAEEIALEVASAPEPQQAMRVWFSEPVAPHDSSYRGGVDEQLVAAIDQAGESVDLAAYHINLWSIRDALLRAHARGVDVRVVTEANYIHEPEIETLRMAGVPVDSDERAHLMHHKFVVIDQQEVWTGSMNFTVNGAYHNNNNLVWFDSTRLAQNYTLEFEEMFVYDRYGALSEADTPFPRVEIGNSRVEVFFSPEDGVQARLLEILQDAHRSIEVLAFSFTADPIGASLIDADRRGVIVRVVVERSQSSASGAEGQRLRDAGLDLRLDGNPKQMHHKVMIIDAEIVVVGSYNFTRSAEEKNDENLLIVYDAQLAGQFLEEFDRIYSQSTP